MAMVVTVVEEAPSNFAPFPAADYATGALRFDKQQPSRSDRREWVRPWRFQAQQVRALSSCAAWHPAMYAQMAQATAGVVITFVTDARTVWVDVWPDAEPKATTAQVELAAGGPTTDPMDSVSVSVAGRLVYDEMPPVAPGCLRIDVEAARRAQGRGKAALPGMDGATEVRVYLPCLRGCRVAGIYHDGAMLEKSASKPFFLAIGDSITQGFLAGDSALTWACRVADARGWDLLNQGVGGQVFQASSLTGLEGLEPECLWVAFGTNYRFNACNAARVKADISAFFKTLHNLFPLARTYVATPLYSDEKAYATHAKSCYSEVPAMIAEAVAPYGNMELVDGHELMDPVPKLYADPDHPDATGHAQMAQRVVRVTKGLPAKEPRPASTVMPVVTCVTESEEVVEPEPKRPRKRRKKERQPQLFEDVMLPLVFDDEPVVEPEPLVAAEPAPERADPAPEPEPVRDVALFDFDDIAGDGPEEEMVSALVKVSEAYTARHDGKPFNKDERQAIKTLGPAADAGDAGALVMCDAIARGKYVVLYADDDCVCLDTSPISAMIWSKDPETAELVAEDVNFKIVTTMNPEINEVAWKATGHEGPVDPQEYWQLCMYLGEKAPEHTSHLTVDPLDASWAPKLHGIYSHPEFYSVDEIATACDEGRMWGAFDERCDFVGFIGLHPDGAMGLLEILPKYRGKGYATELESILIGMLLDKGWLPWGQVFTYNDASFNLQRKLGLTIDDKRLICAVPPTR